MIRLTIPDTRTLRVAFLRSGRLLTDDLGQGHVLRLWDVGRGEVVREVPWGVLFGWGGVRPQFLPGGEEFVRRRGVWSDDQELPADFWTPKYQGLTVAGPDSEQDADAICFHAQAELALSRGYVGSSSTSRFTLRRGDTAVSLFDWQNAYAASGMFSPDGGRVAVVKGDKLVRVWDVVAVREECQLEQTAGANAVTFLTDDLLAVAAGKLVRVWDVRTKKVKHKCPAFGDVVTALAVSPDGTRLIGGSRDGTVRVWNTASFDETARYDWQVGRVFGIAIAHDGLMAAVAGDGGVVVWDLE